nr:zinc finger, CCHC-type [Tanacetum cinerariifolium]
MLKLVNYSLWAIRMQIILEANGLWKMIEPNEETQANNKKYKTAMAFLYQALPDEQLLQITKHKIAKAIWDALKTRHTGEERVQQARLQTLKSDFEMLHMKEDETIDTFTTKLTTLVNKAASLGHTMKDKELVRKLLNAIPNRYLQIVASIEQYSDLDEMTLEEAIGRLKTYEERIKYNKGKQVDNQERFGTLDKPVVHMFLHNNSRPNSPPRPRTTSSDYASVPPSQNRRGAKEAHRTSTTGVPSNLRKASSTFNFFDDLRQFLVLLQHLHSSKKFEGEPEERRRARLERERRQSAGRKESAGSVISIEQEERNISIRISFCSFLIFINTSYIKNINAKMERIILFTFVIISEDWCWAAGKEGNLRALQSSIQYQRQSESGETAAALVSFAGESAAFFLYRFTLCNTLNNLKINLEHFAIEAKMKDEYPFGL